MVSFACLLLGENSHLPDKVKEISEGLLAHQLSEQYGGLKLKACLPEQVGALVPPNTVLRALGAPDNVNYSTESPFLDSNQESLAAEMTAFTAATLGAFVSGIIQTYEHTSEPQFGVCVAGCVLWLGGYICHCLNGVDLRKVNKAGVGTGVKFFTGIILMLSLVNSGLSSSSGTTGSEDA